MSHQVVGYIRVSSKGQSTARQLEGIKLDKEFVDICTGSILEREGLKACIDYVREGDTLVVDSIDRLGRNLRDLQHVITLINNKGASVRFVKENLTFTGQDDPMSTLMLQMMGSFAEFERTMIKSRQKEGIEISRKKGTKSGKPFGKPPLDPRKKKEAVAHKESGLNISQIAKAMKLSRPSVYKLLSI